MKNLPDDILFSNIKARLSSFEEDPSEDTWAVIAANISTTEPRWIKVVERSSLIFALVVACAIRFVGDSAADDHIVLSKVNQTTIPLSTFRDRSRIDAKTIPLASSIRPWISLPAQPHNDRDTNTKKQLRDYALRHGIDLARYKDHVVSQIPTRTKTDQTPIEPLFATKPSHRTEAKSHRAEARSESNVSDTRGSDARAGTPSSLADSLTTMSLPAFGLKTQSVISIIDSASLVKPAVAQPARRRKSRLSLYAMATPSLTFHHVNPSTSDDATFKGLNSPGVMSTERLTFKFESGLQYSLGRRLFVFSGLTYYNQSIDLSLDQVTDGNGFTKQGSSGFQIQPNTTTTEVSYNMQNIGITVGLGYTVHTSKIMHHLGGGLIFEHGLIQRSAETDRRSSNSYLNYQIFYRAEYSVNRRLSIFFQPSFTSSLIYDELMDGALRVKQSRAGFGMGLLYRVR